MHEALKSSARNHRKELYLAAPIGINTSAPRIANTFRTLFHAFSISQENAMQAKNVKVPGPDHPITIEPNAKRVIVKVAGKVIADTVDALTLKEASYPAVQYVPRKDVDMSLLARTENATYCPYKGDCAYFSIPAGGEKAVNAVWTYETPYDAVIQIKDHLAFYTDRVESVTEQAAT
jgi:uncharacterized protein (DUF427 family)